MNPTHESSGQVPRSLADLLARYLHRQTTAYAEGLGFTAIAGQMTPYDAVPTQPIEPRSAWRDALAVAPYFSAKPDEVSGQAPPDWSSLTAAAESAVSLAFCLGNFPQMVRNLQPLLAGGDVAKLRPTAGRRSAASASLLHWASAARGYPGVLLAAGVLRMSRHFEVAETLLKSAGQAPAAWQMFAANEEAALTWHRGQADEALKMWREQKTSVPVLFNRGMAALFLGRSAEARPVLREAIAHIPDSNAWHHLGQLYLAL